MPNTRIKVTFDFQHFSPSYCNLALKRTSIIIHFFFIRPSNRLIRRHPSRSLKHFRTHYFIHPLTLSSFNPLLQRVTIQHNPVFLPMYQNYPSLVFSQSRYPSYSALTLVMLTDSHPSPTISLAFLLIGAVLFSQMPEPHMLDHSTLFRIFCAHEPWTGLFLCKKNLRS